MKTISLKAVALALAFSLGAQAAEGKAVHASSGGGHSDTGLLFLDLFVDLVMIGIEVSAFDSGLQSSPPPPEGYLQQERRFEGDDAPPPDWRRSRRRVQSREGLLLSFGIGGGSMFISNESAARTGAFDLDFRLGYGFSDRFQFFLDADVGAGSYANGLYGSNDLATWTFTLRGQTVLIGDRAGNGLNLNLGTTRASRPGSRSAPSSSTPGTRSRPGRETATWPASTDCGSTSSGTCTEAEPPDTRRAGRPLNQFFDRRSGIRPSGRLPPAGPWVPR